MRERTVDVLTHPVTLAVLVGLAVFAVSLGVELDLLSDGVRRDVAVAAIDGSVGRCRVHYRPAGRRVAGPVMVGVVAFLAFVAALSIVAVRLGEGRKGSPHDAL